MLIQENGFFLGIMSIIDEILIVRPPESSGNAQVRRFVSQWFGDYLGWHVTTQSFNQTTLWPYYENITFNNIIATQETDLIVNSCSGSSSIFSPDRS